MAVFRVERTRDYTVMSNYHLKDTGLTLKAKGLLCPDWYAARSAAHRAFRLICHSKTPAPPVLCGRGRKEGKPLWIFCGMP